MRCFGRNRRAGISHTSEGAHQYEEQKRFDSEQHTSKQSLRRTSALRRSRSHCPDPAIARRGLVSGQDHQGSPSGSVRYPERYGSSTLTGRPLHAAAARRSQPPPTGLHCASPNSCDRSVRRRPSYRPVASSPLVGTGTGSGTRRSCQLWARRRPVRGRGRGRVLGLGPGAQSDWESRPSRSLSGLAVPKCARTKQAAPARRTVSSPPPDRHTGPSRPVEHLPVLRQWTVLGQHRGLGPGPGADLSPSDPDPARGRARARTGYADRYRVGCPSPSRTCGRAQP